jgi:hypothetical protein
LLNLMSHRWWNAVRIHIKERPIRGAVRTAISARSSESAGRGAESDQNGKCNPSLVEHGSSLLIYGLKLPSCRSWITRESIRTFFQAELHFREQFRAQRYGLIRSSESLPEVAGFQTVAHHISCSKNDAAAYTR